MTTIAIRYNLYRKQQDGLGKVEYVPVDQPPELQVEEAIRAVDTNKRVNRVDDSTQSDELDRYLRQDVSWVLPIMDYTIDFAGRVRTIWDATVRDWVDTLVGGSNAYPVAPTDVPPGEASLWLCVSTEGAGNEAPNAGDMQTPGSPTLV